MRPPAAAAGRRAAAGPRFRWGRNFKHSPPPTFVHCLQNSGASTGQAATSTNQQLQVRFTYSGMSMQERSSTSMGAILVLGRVLATFSRMPLPLKGMSNLGVVR